MASHWEPCVDTTEQPSKFMSQLQQRMACRRDERLTPHGHLAALPRSHRKGSTPEASCGPGSTDTLSQVPSLVLEPLLTPASSPVASTGGFPLQGSLMVNEVEKPGTSHTHVVTSKRKRQQRSIQSSAQKGAASRTRRRHAHQPGLSAGPEGAATPDDQEDEENSSDHVHDTPASSSHGTQLRSKVAAYPEGVLAGPESDPRQAKRDWVAPPSPFSLLEEVLYDNPWALILTCILLNRTTGHQVRKVLGPLLRAFPTAQALAAADDPSSQALLQSLLRPLGLFRSRAARLVRYSQEFIHKQWHDPRELHGVGQYAADAYALFCRGAWQIMPAPADKDLHKYWAWMHATGGAGEGLQRESLQQVMCGEQPSD